MDGNPARLETGGSGPVTARNRLTAGLLLGWIALLTLASVAVVWLRN